MSVEPSSGEGPLASNERIYPGGGPFPSTNKPVKESDIHVVYLSGFRVTLRGGGLQIERVPDQTEGMVFIKTQVEYGSLPRMVSNRRPMTTKEDIWYVLPVKVPASFAIESIPTSVAYFREPKINEEWNEIKMDDPIRLSLKKTADRRAEFHVRLILPKKHQGNNYYLYGHEPNVLIYDQTVKNTGITIETIKSMYPSRQYNIRYAE